MHGAHGIAAAAAQFAAFCIVSAGAVRIGILSVAGSQPICPELTAQQHESPEVIVCALHFWRSPAQSE